MRNFRFMSHLTLFSFENPGKVTRNWSLTIEQCGLTSTFWLNSGWRYQFLTLGISTSLWKNMLTDSVSHDKISNLTLKLRWKYSVKHWYFDAEIPLSQGQKISRHDPDHDNVNKDAQHARASDLRNAFFVSSISRSVAACSTSSWMTDDDRRLNE